MIASVPDRAASTLANMEADELADRRPPPGQRCFSSASVEAAIQRVGVDIACPRLRRLFANTLATDAARLGGEIRLALDALPVPWPYEMDGFGSVLIMDDANVPSLLSLPWLGAVRFDDARWRQTRCRVLSDAGNPYHMRGRVAAGVGSPHTGTRAGWPLALVMQALTADDDAERSSLLRTLLAGSARTGFMHEAFDADNPTRFTRPWFAWANSMFGELVLTLHETRPHVLRELAA